MSTKTYKRLLTIAGSDSGGGAGIQADIKTFSALKCYGMSVITALTAQNTQSVSAVYEVEADFVGQQITSVIEDIGVDAVKIGMLFSSDIIREVARLLIKFNVRNIVLDPVMVAKSGDKLLKDNAISDMKKYLFPISTLITPNIPEAEVLSEVKIIDDVSTKKAAEILLKMGSPYVLLKGGHLDSNNSTDKLFYKENNEIKINTFSDKRIDTTNTHGTGCTTSAAIASFLAYGHSIPDSVKYAKQYLHAAIKSGSDYKIGNGHGPVHHFHPYW